MSILDQDLNLNIGIGSDESPILFLKKLTGHIRNKTWCNSVKWLKIRYIMGLNNNVKAAAVDQRSLDLDSVT